MEKIFAVGNPIRELYFGSNLLLELKEMDLSDCSLPLSALLKCVGKGSRMNILGPQQEVFFEEWMPDQGRPAVLDLSSEAVIQGEPTSFSVLDIQKKLAPPENYEIDGGLIRFNALGRYQVMMSNPKIFSTAAGHPETVRAYTGWVDIR